MIVTKSNSIVIVVFFTIHCLFIYSEASFIVIFCVGYQLKTLHGECFKVNNFLRLPT